MKKKAVIALGHRALGTTLPEQKTAVRRTAKVIADLVEAGYQLAITHSNGPQVGMIHSAMNEFGKTHADYTAAPMSVCSAMSQGYIGYDLQNSIREELLNRGIYRAVSTVLTQVTVDPYDDAFFAPSKVIGRLLTKEEADAEVEKGNHVVEEAGGYRRIIAAPRPQEIVEMDAIRLLVDANQIVIACGGGGIPVMEQENHLKGASAVIEKDYAAGKLAELLDADELIILTGVEHVLVNRGAENEAALGQVSVEKMKAYMKEGHFEENSMLPKIEAAVSFLEKRQNRKARITSFDKLGDSVKGRAGTIISNA